MMREKGPLIVATTFCLQSLNTLQAFNRTKSFNSILSRVSFIQNFGYTKSKLEIEFYKFAVFVVNDHNYCVLSGVY